jgi:hypothetical protein
VRSSVALVGLSGFIYVAIVLGWAVYLVPCALRRYDEAARNRPVTRFSSRMRVLGRSDVEALPADTRVPDAGAVAPPPAPAEPAAAEPAAPKPAAPAPQPPVTRGPQQLAAARTAARRRRRVLLVLLGAAGVTAVAAGLALVSWWSVTVPGGLAVVWLAVCRSQARHEADACWARDGGYVEPDVGDLRRTNRLEPPRIDTVARDVAAADAGDPPVDVGANDEPTVVLEREQGDEMGTDGAAQGSLWDPVPVTLPTYVHKPRAHRTTRTVDLTGSGGGQPPKRAEESAIYTHRVERSSRSEDADPEHAAEPQGDETTEHKGPARRAVGE